MLGLYHTLIYGSYVQTEPAEFLFKHNKYLKPLDELLVENNKS